MDINAKYRPFYIARLLEELTDENHYLTTVQISNLLEERYGMTTHRQTIAADMEILRTVGMDIQCIYSTQNRYWLRSRRFDDAELQTLIDAVKGCQSINDETKEMLIGKLAKEAGVGKLYLTHVSRRYRERDILSEAQSVFERTEVARDFSQFQIKHGDE